MIGSRKRKGALIYRQTLVTRLTHWVWVICLFFLLLSGLQIFQARPDLYIGKQSGFDFDNTILSIGAYMDEGAMKGRTLLFGEAYDTTGWLGAVPGGSGLTAQSFPGWLTIPSYRDLATGRVVHFFFAWTLVFTLTLWFIGGLFSGHVRNLLPKIGDLKGLPRDILNHLRFRFHKSENYNTLQKLSYAGVLFVALPVMILTGLTMSPGMDAFAPILLDIFGGRQTARTIHFGVMLALILFFAIHILMVLLAGPLNELRSMTTGWYRLSGPKNKADLDTPFEEGN
ncbi:cytochrome b/b6 domain-containing protein [Fulvimarina sp. MAC8]|uniref:cytochrome b/b6 domain-containing protein n=1 Tax=Fulvimarina sp. MAC8 TaxID=3162874 RepID=UPI0032EAEE54